MGVEEARRLLSIYSVEKVGQYARIDAGRKNRRGIPEVVFAEGKTLGQVTAIIDRTVGAVQDCVLVSRIREGDMAGIIRHARGAGLAADGGEDGCSSLLLYGEPPAESYGTVGIVCAGTSDVGVAEEARLMCRAMNCGTMRSYDVGVAGMHRLFPALKGMVEAGVGAVVAVAGMEGALATVVSSAVDVPVVGVPTSVGYGYGGGGAAALAAMLQSCSLGLTVVNIDNGIGAGAAAANVCRLAARGGPPSPGTRTRTC